MAGSEDLIPKDKDGNIIFDPTDFTETYAVSIDELKISFRVHF